MFYLSKIKEITIEIKQDLKEKLKKRREEKLNLLNKKKRGNWDKEENRQ